MQITDMLSQYNRNIANGTEISNGTQGIKQISSSLQELSVGNVFEGNINSVENGTVTLGLPDGKTIQARLDSGVSVRVGESMFFQVRSNNGAQIAIRPFSSALGTNPTILNALEAANLQVNGKTITMVNAMMEQSMSIDKQSLMNMARIVMGNEGIDVNSIVQMVKLGIPVTDELVAQFENYKSDQYAILDQLETVMELLPEQLSNGAISEGQLMEFNQQILSIFFGEEGAEDGKVLVQPNEEMASQSGEALSGAQAEELAAGEGDAEEVTFQSTEEILASLSGIGEFDEEMAFFKEQNLRTEAEGQAAVDETGKRIAQPEADAVSRLLTDEELKQFAKQLSEIPEFSKNPTLFQDGVFQKDISSKELMRLLAQTFSTKDGEGGAELRTLVSSKEYRVLLRNVMEQQWLLKPEELKTEHKVNELYERLDRQLSQMESALKGFGQSTAQLSNTAENVRSNIQFMNQINQIYAYVQLPLRLSGQNAHSDLYVYTDKRRRGKEDGELTAFLHLDLDHLGSTDVSIKMYKKQVATDFYLSDDTSYQLILGHLDVLQQRLEEKGYNIMIQVKNQAETVNFVEDLLNRGAASAGGMVHRYSFDVRA